MTHLFTFKGYKYSYNSETKELFRVASDGKGRVPVSMNHPSLHGISDYIQEEVISR